MNITQIKGNVNILCSDGKSVSGCASEYYYPDENENGEACIVLLREEMPPLMLYESDIKSFTKLK